jgi:alditol oxidase
MIPRRAFINAFLEVSSTLMAARLFSRSKAPRTQGQAQPPMQTATQADAQRLTNWAGNLTYSTGSVSYPRSAEEVASLVKKHDRLKALGTRHCFNTIADSPDHLISLKEMNRVIALDAQARTVTLEGGINYGQLCPQLQEKGFALHNLASLPHISVAGACTTATHGSGVKNGNLASAVTGLELVIADGTIVSLSKARDGERFHAAVVGLGALGVVTKVTLAIQPAFSMRQYVFEDLPLPQAAKNFDAIMSAGYSVSLFTDWQRDRINEVWVKSVLESGSGSRPGGAGGERVEMFGARPATKNLHPIAELSAEHCTEQLGVPGPWFERLPHFRMGFTPSSGKELQSEYFVPRGHAVEAMLAIQRMGARIGPHLLISEIRTIDADTLWMSPCYKQPSVALHFTWKQDWPAVRQLLPVIERELAPFNVRPHWGKLFTVAPAVLRSRYEKLDEFRKMAAEYDPRGKFQNAFLKQNVLA